jgi:cytochrome c oxidase subunit 2
MTHLAAFWHAIGGDHARLLPLSASSFSDVDNQIMLYMMIVSAVSALGIFSTLVYFALKYRRRPGNETAHDVPVSYRLETAWTLVPFSIVLVAFFWGARRYLEMMTPRRSTENIFILGKQWMWKIEHANGVSEINRLHVPVGKDINLIMISQDVIHSFFVPDFRLKYDVLPGRYTHAWFRAEKTGTFFIFCSQYCGTDHAHMIGAVEVMEPEAYDHWLHDWRPADEPAIESSVSRGRRLFATQGCVSCHASAQREKSIGPDLKGRFTRGDENLVRNDLIHPSQTIAAGYRDVMPTYQGLLKEEEIFDLVTYLTSSEPVHD